MVHLKFGFPVKKIAIKFKHLFDLVSILFIRLRILNITFVAELKRLLCQ